MSKEEKGVITQELNKLTIALPFEEKAADERDKDGIKKRLREVKAFLEEMVAFLKSKGYLKASGYLERAGKKLFTYVELWLEKSIQVGKAISIMRRTMREIAR